jgi:hypothetical protein
MCSSSLKAVLGLVQSMNLKGKYDEPFFAQFATYFSSRDFVLLGFSNRCFRAMVLAVASRELLLLPRASRSLLCDGPKWGLGLRRTKSNDLLAIARKQRDRN